MDIEKIVSAMSLEEKAAFCSGFDFWHTKAFPNHQIPSVMMCDGPHGLRKQEEGSGDHLGIHSSIETVCYPTASALAASFDRSLLSELGEALGQECKAEGVGMLLGPGLNIKRSPLCGRNFEYFSEDPYLAGELAASYIQGIQGKGVAACVKHFACNNQETMRMSASAEVDERTLHEIYLPAFEAAVKSGVRSVMCAYNGVNGVFCAENRYLLTDTLRKKWGFGGFVVTDWGAAKDRAEGIKAGVDLEMPGRPDALGDEICQAVRNGTLSEQELDQTVSRLLKFVDDAREIQEGGASIDRELCRNLSRRLAAQCAVLLKNNGVLPLSRDMETVFIGAFAEKPRYQGSGSSHIHVRKAVGAVEAAEGLLFSYAPGFDPRETAPNWALIEQAAAAAKRAGVAVVFAGLTDAEETEGCDRDSMKLPENQNALIQAVAAANPNTVVVLHGGAPMELPWMDKVAAILCVHLGGEQVGAATVDLLYGVENPSGHLAETWPFKLADNPSYLNFPGEDGTVQYAEGIYVGYRYYDKKEMNVAFPFGHGLSYTSFQYHDLQINRAKMTERDTAEVTCKVTNTGARSGKAVVQLYVADLQSSVRRPVRELKGFAKVSLKPGETAQVAFTLDKRSFAYYEAKCHDWFVESGEFAVEIGESSRDIRLRAELFVEGTTPLPFTVTAATTIGQLMRHPTGAAFVEKMGGNSKNTADTQNMGEGSQRMMQRMMLDMPLGALVNFGRMTPQQLSALIAKLNDTSTCGA